MEQVAVNSGGCVTGAGQPASVVYVPSGHYPPRLGTTADLNTAASGVVARTASAVLVLALLAVIAAAARRQNDWAIR